jgi:hypothetical protein
MIDEERAADDDYWFRVITSDKHVTKGKVNHGAFTKEFRKPKQGKGRPWLSEMSGRLRSQAGTSAQIIEHGKGFATAWSTKFHGIAFVSCDKLTYDKDGLSMAAYFTPLPDGKWPDPAHADLAVFGKEVLPRSEEEERLFLHMHKHMVFLHPDQIDPIFHLMPPPITPNSALPSIAGG